MGDLSHEKSFSLYDLGDLHDPGDLGELCGSLRPEVSGILGVVCQESMRTSWMSSNATRGEKIETDMTELTAVDLPLCRIRATVFDQRQVHLRGNSHLRRELPGLLSPARVSWEVETAWRPSHRTRHWQ